MRSLTLKQNPILFCALLGCVAWYGALDWASASEVGGTAVVTVPSRFDVALDNVAKP